MLTDARLQMENKISMAAGFTVAASPVLGTKSIDLGAAAIDALGNTIPSDLAKGKTLRVHAQITTAVTSGGAATLQLQVIQADNAALTTNKEVLTASAAIAKATLVAGYKFKDLQLDPNRITRRHIGCQWNVAVADLTAGAADVGLVLVETTSPGSAT